MAPLNDQAVDGLVEPQAPIGYRRRTGCETDAEPEVPPPRWWSAVAALVIVCCSVLATVLVPVRVTEPAALLHTSAGSVSAVVWTSQAPESFLGRLVHLRIRGARLEARVRAASTFALTGTQAAIMNGTTEATTAVRIVVALPAAPVGAKPSRIEVDFGQESLFADFMR